MFTISFKVLPKNRKYLVIKNHLEDSQQGSPVKAMDTWLGSLSLLMLLRFNQSYFPTDYVISLIERYEPNTLAYQNSK